MIQSLLIFNWKGELLLNRRYILEPNIKLSVLVETFRVFVIHDNNSSNGVFCQNDHSYLSVTNRDVYLVAISDIECNGALIFEVLRKMVHTFEKVFGEFSEAAVKSNFIQIYAILEGNLH
jgi:AP-2 complex subunit mu-1